jgi:hypothetical protein
VAVALFWLLAVPRAVVACLFKFVVSACRTLEQGPDKSFFIRLEQR